MATQKQKELVKKILHNPSMEIGNAMKEVGYSENTRPHDVLNTKSWEELTEEYLPNDDMLAVHQEGLTAMKQIGALVLVKQAKDGSTSLITKDNEGMIEVPDHSTRAKFLELGYKIKGKLKDGLNVQGDLNMTVNIVRHASE